MINWRRLFSSTALQRGLKYYYDGSIENFVIDGTIAEAVVEGRLPYYVQIKIVSPTALYMECDCPNAQDGYKCKHMAAVCLEAEDYRLDIQKNELTYLDNNYLFLGSG